MAPLSLQLQFLNKHTENCPAIGEAIHGSWSDLLANFPCALVSVQDCHEGDGAIEVIACI